MCELVLEQVLFSFKHLCRKSSSLQDILVCVCVIMCLSNFVEQCFAICAAANKVFTFDEY